MDNNTFIYNKIDFSILAPRYKIAFSYINERKIPFVREYLLRLLKITDCTAKQLAQFFDFSERELDIALEDLLEQKWIEWNNDGRVELSNAGRQLFEENPDIPFIPSLEENKNDYYCELIGCNFVRKEQTDNRKSLSIELEVYNEIMADSTTIVKKEFQRQFNHLVEENIVTVDNNTEQKDTDIQLYKIELIEKIYQNYFRLTQAFELQIDDNGHASEKERDDIYLTKSENIEYKITDIIDNYRTNNNISELMQSMELLQDDNTLKLIAGGNLNFHKFLELNQELEQDNGFYFIGQTYQHDKIYKIIEDTIKKLTKKPPKQPLKLLWLTPSDIYWGKSNDIRKNIELLRDNQKIKKDNKEYKEYKEYKLYDFRLYFPLSDDSKKNFQHEKGNILYEFKDYQNTDILYAFKEGFLVGNTEIIILQEHFVIVCYHAKLDNYQVTFPIGFFTTEKKYIQQIYETVNTYLTSRIFDSELDFDTNDFGLLK